MSPELIDADGTKDERDLVHRAVEALVEGKLVAFPTETVYGVAASALHEGAVDRLLRVKGRLPGHPLTLAVKGYDEALDYCPDMSPVGQRLARRCWPGPVTLVLDGHHEDSLAGRLPASVRAAVSPSGQLGFRVPDHRFVLSALRLLPGPIALTSANRGGQAEAITGTEVAEALGDDIDLILNDGPCKYGQASSVVQVAGNRLQVLRQGVVSESALRRFASLMLLIVCTGNTCRSPMAQSLAQLRLANRLGCPLDSLEDRGVMVLSAGLAAFPGSSASPEAVQVIQERGMDLTRHESRSLTDSLVLFADLILTMTQGHRNAIIDHWPEAAAKTALLCRDGQSVSDPIGGTVADYAACAQQIDQHLAEWVETPLLENLPVFL